MAEENGFDLPVRSPLGHRVPVWQHRPLRTERKANAVRALTTVAAGLRNLSRNWCCNVGLPGRCAYSLLFPSFFRCAHRFFIICDMRFLAAGLMRRRECRLGRPLGDLLLSGLAAPSSAAIAISIRSRSRFSCATISLMFERFSVGEVGGSVYQPDMGATENRQTCRSTNWEPNGSGSLLLVRPSPLKTMSRTWKCSYL